MTNTQKEKAEKDDSLVNSKIEIKQQFPYVVPAQY